MIKDKVDKCAETSSSNGSSNEEVSTCEGKDNAIEESGTATKKKDEDSASASPSLSGACTISGGSAPGVGSNSCAAKDPIGRANPASTCLTRPQPGPPPATTTTPNGMCSVSSSISSAAATTVAALSSSTPGLTSTAMSTSGPNTTATGPNSNPAPSTIGPSGVSPTQIQPPATTPGSVPPTQVQQTGPASCGPMSTLSGTDPNDVNNILDSTASSAPAGPPAMDDSSLTERNAPPIPPDLQPESFNDLGPSQMPQQLRQPPMMQHGRPNGIQPLVSNVINKQSGNMEVQYMQQQSQIFVFSTMLANKSAEAVFQGQFQSIIAYHCAQPGTKKYFEKHPLKLTQFHRQSPAQWLNGIAMMKNKGCTRGSMVSGAPNTAVPPSQMTPISNYQAKPGAPMGGAMGDGFPPADGIVDDISALQDSDVPWEQRTNPMSIGMEGRPSTGPNVPNDGPNLADATLDDACLSGGSPATVPDPATLMLGHSPCITNAAPTSPSLANLQPSLQGVKIPDEDLTPQQRQHREEQLATIRKMQQMLFPEENAPLGLGDDHEMTPSGNESDGVVPGVSAPGSMPPCQAMHSGPPSTSISGHIDWQKLQNQFFDGKMKPQGGMGDPMGPGHGLRQMAPGPAGGPGAPPTHLSPQVPGGVVGGRLQGPPPPYHQTPRSASVPIALQSPSPASPNNPTSNLSLPSPRTSSSLNSPADSSNRQFSGLNRHFSTTQSPTSQNSPSTTIARSGGNTVSNPSTPISSHFSPSSVPQTADPLTAVTTTTVTSSDFPVTNSSSNHHNPEGMFCRTLQSMAQKQHVVGGLPNTDITGSPNKEPNLMPVPSPQQIQYCNTFEGQELTIQKQPNTSLKDRNMTSPSSIDGGFGSDMCSSGSNVARVSAPNTPLTPSSVDMGPRFPLPTSGASDCYRITAPSPNAIDSKNPRPSPQSVGNRPTMDGMKPTNSEASNMRFTNASPLDGHNRYSLIGVGGSPNSFPSQSTPGGVKPGGNMMSISPSGKTGPLDSIVAAGPRADNVPLNPNSNNGLPGNPKGSHFDPISSLAQMSQLLTSTVSSSMNGQSAGPGPGMMSYGNVNAPPMDMNRPEMGPCSDMDGGMIGMGGMQGPPHVYNTPGMSSPKNMPFMPPQRMMRPNMGQGPIPYNGTNVQVKASAPNTIQYLPARPQIGPSNPRGPPSLDFLQRYANPSMESKMPPGQNMQYFPGCPPNNISQHIDGNPMHNDGIMASLMNGPMMNKMPMAGGIPQGMMPMGMGGGGMRNPNAPGGLRQVNNNAIRMHGGMGVFDPSNMGGDGMYSPGGPGPGPQMFGPPGGIKGGPMGRGMCAPDASQPLPPSVGQAGGYKNSPFGSGATTADPNYAQQFHNFQQQLYATSTRSQLNSQGPGPPTPQAPPNNNHMYFMSK